MMKGFRPTDSMQSWRSASKCATLTPARADELFFADGAHPDTVEHAKAYCASCPVKAQCAAWGAAINAEFGVYGGVPSYARKSLVRLYRETHPEENTATLSEDERFSRFAQWISENPGVIGQAIHNASHTHNRAYWQKKRARIVSVQAGDIELSGIIRIADTDPVPDRCVQLTLF